MDFPDFNDFLATLDKETISGIMKDARIAADVPLEVDLRYPERLAEDQMLAAGFQSALGLLASYHIWLSQYF